MVFSGDWAFKGKNVSYKDWTLFPASIEDALIYTLLSNFFFYMKENYDIENTALIEHKELLWSHSAWGETIFQTTNDHRQLIFAPLGLVERN